jgi:hypothetical protein
MSSRWVVAEDTSAVSDPVPCAMSASVSRRKSTGPASSMPRCNAQSFPVHPAGGSVDEMTVARTFAAGRLRSVAAPAGAASRRVRSAVPSVLPSSTRIIRTGPG